MKKTLKIIAKTTASTLLASMATSCGTEEATPSSNAPSKHQIEKPENANLGEKFEITVREITGSLDVVRCDGNCRTNGK